MDDMRAMLAAFMARSGGANMQEVRAPGCDVARHQLLTSCGMRCCKAARFPAPPALCCVLCSSMLHINQSDLASCAAQVACVTVPVVVQCAMQLTCVRLP